MNEKFIKKSIIKKYKKKEIITADFETITIEKIHYVYAIGWYNGKIYNKKIITKNIKSQSENLILDFIDEINKKGKKTIVYFHNLGTFDGLFIISSILEKLNNKKIEEKTFKMIIRNNKIYQIKYKNIKFLDSLNIVNDSLENLSITFLNQGKYNFDPTLIKKEDDINKNYYKIEKYLEIDVLNLWKIMYKIRSKIIKLFNTDIINFMSISSLSFNIFREKYMEEENIYISNKENIDKFLRKSYIGGLTNVFIPKGKNLLYYDINSLYPYSMLNPMPIGEPKFIKKNELKNIDINNFFGFIEASVEIKEQKIPTLPIKIDESIILPYGKMESVWFSEELKNSVKKHGTKIIKIKSALQFEKSTTLFENYINNLYKLRTESKNKTENYIYKILMNSLYGRFGMKKEISKTLVIERKDIHIYEILFKNIQYNKTNNKNNIIITILFKGDLVSLETLNKLNIEKKLKKNIINLREKTTKEVNKMNIAVQISSAIASYSRILMINLIKEIGEDKIYYMDTDSIFTNNEIDEKLCSNKTLGKFKLENKLKKCYFLSPKCYMTIDNNNIKNIKFKGLPKNIKNNIEEKWFLDNINNVKKNNNFKFKNGIKKNLKEFKVTSIETSFNAKLTSKKRIKIIKNNTWIDTKPHKL